MNNKYKSIPLTIFFVMLVVIITSLYMNGKASIVESTSKNNIAFDGNKNEKDVTFLINAAEMNMEEINLGKLARQKGSSSNIKELGKMMEEEHDKSLNELTTLAKNKKIDIPTKFNKQENEAYKNLNEKSGLDFDKAYTILMINKHTEAIKLFEKAYTETSDSDIRMWTINTLPTLRNHLEHAIICQRKI